MKLENKHTRYLTSKLLLFCTFLLGVAPLLLAKRTGIFWSIDPEVMYLSNALSWIKQHQIQYIDHPGTPSIRIIAIGLLPLRVYAKLIGTPFIAWVTQNYSLVFFYSRVLSLLIVTFAVLLATTYINKKKGVIISLLWWVLTFSYSFTPYLLTVISAESYSFLLIIIWCIYLGHYLSNPKQFHLPIILALLAGLATANKFTNLFTIPASLSLIMTNSALRHKFKNLVFAALSSAFGFLFGTWSIRDRYSEIISWVTRLFTTSEIHGGGERSVFSTSTYFRSLLTHITTDRYVWVVVLLGLVWLSISWFYKRKKSLPQLVVALIFAAGFFIFAKYPLNHYQVANFTVLVFVLCMELKNQSRKFLILPIIILSLVPLKDNLTNYLKVTKKEIISNIALNNSIPTVSRDEIVIWDWSRTEQFALHWSRDWGGRFNATEFSQLYPNSYELVSAHSVRSAGGKQEKLDTLVWDRIYLQKDLLINSSELSLSTLSAETIKMNADLVVLSK